MSQELDLSTLRPAVERASYFSTDGSEHPWESIDPDSLIEAIDRAIVAETKLEAVQSLHHRMLLTSGKGYKASCSCGLLLTECQIIVALDGDK